MSDHLIDVRAPLAASEAAVIEIGRDGVLHVRTSVVTLHLDRATCEELTTTLARAMIRLSRQKPPARRPRRVLSLVPAGTLSQPGEPGGP